MLQVLLSTVSCILVWVWVQGAGQRRGLKAFSVLLKGYNGDCATLGAGICLRQLIEETSYLHLCDETSVNGVLGGQMVRFEHTHTKKKNNI